ncbi:LacI family DNA-binding transcriptional regulator [Chloroflexota bacterium]
MSSRPTIDDVAQAAGVSKATVSRVLNGNDHYMRDATRQRVEQAITDLQYRPSSVARSLTSRRTYTVGLLLSDVSNPFYPDVIHGVEDAAFEHGYDVFLCNTNYDLDRGLRFVRSLVDKQVDGVLVMSSTMSDGWLLELQQAGIPTVVLDWEAAPGVTACKIVTDFAPGIRAAVDHLWNLGHRRFAHVSGPLNLPTARRRRDIYLAALADKGISATTVPVVEGNFRINGGREAMPELLALPELPTAIFAANDLMAMGLLTAAREQRIVVPGDLSIIGMDDIWLALETDPALTTVALPRYEIGTTAMTMLLDILQKHDEGEPVYTLPHHVIHTHLITRASTGVPTA